MNRKIPALLVIAIAAGAAFLVMRHRHAPPPPPLSAVQPIIAAQPTTSPTARRAAKMKFPDYLDVVRLANPNVAATQPLDAPVELPDAAHLVLHDPVFVDSVGNLWITHASGQSAKTALAHPGDVEEHIVTDQPIFVHWWTDDAGSWSAAMVVRAATGGYDLITEKNRQHLADDRPYRWDTAFSILGKIVVCTDAGVSVFDIQPKIAEHYHPLPGCTPAGNPPTTLLDTRGILAWSPWENGKPGSNGISRFVDDHWTDLPTDLWPARPIQLSMLLDGSVLRIAANTPPTPSTTPPADDGLPPVASDSAPDHVNLSIGILEATQLDEKHINDLIAQLSDPDSDIRQAAFDELSRYGPALSPLLEKVGDDASPEAKIRISQLLRNKITPALGGLTPVENKLDVMRRFRDGSVLFFAPSGVQIPTGREEPDLVNPAWLVLRPDGRMERPLPASLVGDQKPDDCTLVAVQSEWLVNDGAGIRRFIGNTLEPMLAPTEQRFSQIVGIGARRRWVFRDPGRSGDTLIIDPTVADPNPRLPVWTIAVPNGFAGWDAQNFPAVSRGQNHGNWELQADNWTALPGNEKVITELPAVASTPPATNPAMEYPLLVTADGSQYFDGKNSLVMVSRANAKTVWPLPPEAVGTAEPTLMQTSDGLLFLYNQAGRLLRIRPTPAEAAPFKLEATFTKNIPNVDHPTRVWLDPAGRIDFVNDDNVLTVTFPDGKIPREISRMMLDR